MHITVSQEKYSFKVNSQILSTVATLHASDETWLHLNRDALCPTSAAPSVNQMPHQSV